MRIILPAIIVISLFISSCSTSNIKEPEYREIREIKLVELGLLQSTAGIDLVYYNPNSFGVQLTNAHGDIYVDNAYFGKFELSESINVGKRSEFVVPALLKLDMIGLIKNQRDLINKKEALVRIDGVATVKKGVTREVPLHYEHMQSIEKLRVLLTEKK